MIYKNPWKFWKTPLKKIGMKFALISGSKTLGPLRATEEERPSHIYF